MASTFTVTKLSATLLIEAECGGDAIAINKATAAGLSSGKAFGFSVNDGSTTVVIDSNTTQRVDRIVQLGKSLTVYWVDGSSMASIATYSVGQATIYSSVPFECCYLYDKLTKVIVCSPLSDIESDFSPLPNSNVRRAGYYVTDPSKPPSSQTIYTTLLFDKDLYEVLSIPIEIEYGPDFPENDRVRGLELLTIWPQWLSSSRPTFDSIRSAASTSYGYASTGYELRNLYTNELDAEFLLSDPIPYEEFIYGTFSNVIRELGYSVTRYCSLSSSTAYRVDSDNSLVQSDVGEYIYLNISGVLRGGSTEHPLIYSGLLTISLYESGSYKTQEFIHLEENQITDIQNINEQIWFSNINPDLSYSITITLRVVYKSHIIDGNGFDRGTQYLDTSQHNIAQVSVSVPIGYYTFAVKAGGHGVSFGEAATEDLFNVNMVSQFKDQVTIETDSVPQLALVNLNSGSIDTFVSAIREFPGDNGNVVQTSFGVGAGGVNHGIYSNPLGRWLIYGDRNYGYLMGGVWRIGNNASPGPGFWQSYDYALLRASNSGSNWHPVLAFRTAGGGSWSIGNYNNERLILAHVASGATSNAQASQIYIEPPDNNTSKTIAKNSLAYQTALTSAQVTAALGYTPPKTDTNTTYSFATASNSATTSATSIGANTSASVSYTVSAPSGYSKFTGVRGVTTNQNGSVGIMAWLTNACRIRNFTSSAKSTTLTVHWQYGKI